MAAIVTDQFRILNAENFIESVNNSNNSYYIVLGLPNPNIVGFGRTTNWNDNPPNPTDSINYQNHFGDTLNFGKKITSSNVRRVIRRIDWVQGTRYEMYRHDYTLYNPSPLTNSSRLYDANYYVMNSDFRVYICIDNGSSGISTNGNVSQDQPTFTDVEPSRAGESGDGYVWKYLFTVSPSDIIKFDSTEYIPVPNDWKTSTNSQIVAIRENGDSSVNSNQIKKVYIEKQGSNYSGGLGQPISIIGDGEGAEALVDVVNGKITNVTVTSGGKNYTYGMLNLDSINNNVGVGQEAKLIPIIPPSKGHGFDIYKELGADRVLVYSRFDDSNKDFPIDAKFSQIGIIKNPTSIGSTNIYSELQFSALNSLIFNGSTVSGTPVIGETISQTLSTGVAKGYVASWDTETKVLKYIQDRNLYFNGTTKDQTDYSGISTGGQVYKFSSSGNNNSVIGSNGTFSATINSNFSGITTNPSGNKVIDLGVIFNAGVATPEINKSSGDLIYIDNRPLVSRNPRQKEDIKIILEF